MRRSMLVMVALAALTVSLVLAASASADIFQHSTVLATSLSGQEEVDANGVPGQGARVWAGVEAAPFIRVADADQIGLNWAKDFGFYPPDYEWDPCAVDEEFVDGTRIAVGELELELIATPGHCMGHYCVRLVGRDRTYLFSSDCVFWGGAIILQNVKDSNVQEYAASCNRIAEVEFDALLPGHHIISLRDGRRHAEAAAREFNRIGLPKDLLR